ncbi:uncharacterized protein [Antedon mediterranea]|uniref:uncharacterized protein n=1 Tax=Antedon mediterranea TaxID=105859 RepID=UPI003AF7559E
MLATFCCYMLVCEFVITWTRRRTNDACVLCTNLCINVKAYPEPCKMHRTVRPTDNDYCSLLLEDEMSDVETFLKEAYDNPNYVEIPFDTRKYQAAYMRQYFPELRDFITDELGRFNLKPDDFGLNGKNLLNLNVCSIGGGPGTDVVGVYAYVRSILKDRTLVLTATIIDKYYEWENSWNVIEKKLNLNADQEGLVKAAESAKGVWIKMNGYIGYDINTPATRIVKKSVTEANILLLIKFVSVVKSLPNFKRNLTTILRKASQNSLLIYGDDSKDGSTEIFSGIAERAGFIPFRNRPQCDDLNGKQLNMCFQIWIKKL